MAPPRLKSLFNEAFGVEFPDIISDSVGLVPIDDRPAGREFLFGTQNAKDDLCLAIPHFLSFSPDGYYALIGFWGNGVNSYAFQCTLIDGPIKRFFRLPYGGVYMDNQKTAKLVPKFLVAYFAFERAIIDQLAGLTAIEHMGEGDYHIVLRSDREM